MYCSSILKNIYILFQNVTVGIRSLAEKKWWLERNNKEKLKNKIIEFWDVWCIVKWHGIIDKVTFWNGKIG